MQRILDAKGSLIEDSNNTGRRYVNKGKYSKKRGGYHPKIIRTKASKANDDTMVLHAHAKQHKAQRLTKKLLLKGQMACADASATTNTTGTNIPVAEIIYETTPMQIVDFVEEAEPWADDDREEEL